MAMPLLFSHRSIGPMLAMTVLLSAASPPRAEALPPEITCLDPVLAADPTTCTACPDLGPHGPVYEAFDPAGGEVLCAVEPPCPFGIGATPLAVACADAGGAMSMATCAVEVVDVSTSLVVTPRPPQVLWPPNHRYENVPIESCIDRVELISGCGGGSIPIDPSLLDITIVRITSSEPEDDKLDRGGARGDGHTCMDMVISDATTVRLRKERAGRGEGRMYAVYFKMRYDAVGATGTGMCKYAIPHSKREPVPTGECQSCVGADCGDCPTPQPACGRR
jgi:hypothetical protein